MARVFFVHLGVWLAVRLTAASGFSSIETAAEDLLRPTLVAPQQFQEPDEAPGGCARCTRHKPEQRSRRCTCYSFMDKECVYYCHLDIIWVNSPERTVPYGLSSYRGSQRKRRNATVHRCSCTSRSDPKCQSFCRLHLLEKDSLPFFNWEPVPIISSSNQS
ncbi:hypothetical protein DNTS_008275 [Danionella cerebrum]|uniref:Endothelin-3 n=1 Tax=Danionella cerebrum TaxID=2873325 RepID=A0A553R6I3_9TELE|nr:hypothetical protein DNTS_008275 [Danionella translucida]